jgi:IS5 family transposase
MKKKTTYRIRNWPEYNSALKQRGSLTIWISDQAIAGWTTDLLTGGPGASPVYTDLAIETMATVQALYSLAGRQTQGFLQSLFDLMKVDLTAPDHSTLSRRRSSLTVTLPVHKSSSPRHLVVDSTGVKVYGEGEWKVRQHGFSKRRTWLKLHLCSDEATLEVMSAVASTNNVSDAEALPDLLQNVPGKIEQVSADGAYDQRQCYDALNQHGAKAAIPPRARERRSGSTATAKQIGTCATRICAGFGRSVASNGNKRGSTIGGVWPRHRCFASKRSSAIGCERGKSAISSKSFY